MFTDTHAHLYLKNFSEDLPQVMKRAKDAGIDLIILPSIDMNSTESVLRLCNEYPGVYGAVGVHPHDCKDFSEADVKRLAELAIDSKIIAIGEIGLDYFYDFTPREKQISAFTRQLDLALELDLPVIVHNRDSDEDMSRIMQRYAGSGLRAQFHCYSGSEDLLKQLIALHHYVSFTGNITFKKMDSIRNLSLLVPLPQLLLETDSPFMTPVPHRGKRNEPELIPLIAETHASLRGLTAKEIGEITTFNAFKFFGIKHSTGLTKTYQLGDALYINVSNRCNADCVFCARHTDPVLHGYNLKMSKTEEPAAAEYLSEIGDPKKYSEIVFCGYGEPSIRWDVVREVATRIKEQGGKTRMNTNGHGNLINKRDIAPEMAGVLDSVSISLNSHDKKQYAEIMRLPESYFEEMLRFAQACLPYVPEVVLSVVDYPGVDIEAAKQVAEATGTKFRVRGYF